MDETMIFLRWSDHAAGLTGWGYVVVCAFLWALWRIGSAKR